MMTSFDAAELMPDADQETMNDHFRNSRWYTPLPSLHVSVHSWLQITFDLPLAVYRNDSCSSVTPLPKYGPRCWAI